MSQLDDSLEFEHGPIDSPRHTTPGLPGRAGVSRRELLLRRLPYAAATAIGAAGLAESVRSEQLANENAALTRRLEVLEALQAQDARARVAQATGNADALSVLFVASDHDPSSMTHGYDKATLEAIAHDIVRDPALSDPVQAYRFACQRIQAWNYQQYPDGGAYQLYPTDLVAALGLAYRPGLSSSAEHESELRDLGRVQGYLSNLSNAAPTPEEAVANAEHVRAATLDLARATAVSRFTIEDFQTAPAGPDDNLSSVMLYQATFIVTDPLLRSVS